MARPTKTEDICEKMRSAGTLPDVVTFSSLDIKKAEEVFGKMKSASKLPDVVKFSSLTGGGRTQHAETKKAENICEMMSRRACYRTW